MRGLTRLLVLMKEIPMRHRCLCVIAVAWLFVSVVWETSRADEPSLPLKAGIIGLDAHALPWTRILNNPKAEGELADMVVVAGFPNGSPDIPQSRELLGKSVEPIRGMGVEIVDSIDALLGKVDVVLILSIDGRVHLEQAKAVFSAGKPVFIDKPVAASLAEAMEIFRLAKEHDVPCFSSSALRFAPGTQAVLGDPKVGSVRGCDAFSPCPLEPHHPDFFWYGIHGVETLFTIMGSGCVSVVRVQTEKADLAVGVWEGGRIGTFRGMREGPHTYGATVFGTKGIAQAGRFEGYEPLLVEIVKFFKTGRPPVSAEQTLQILAFMEAAEQSKRRAGRPVSIESVMEKARASIGR
jgi:predicted dehydrogenase